MAQERAYEQLAFLRAQGWHDCKLESLLADASLRRYFRVRCRSHSAMLMDAPPEALDLQPFITVAKHLSALGLRVPRVIAAEPRQGLVLTEDFGDDTFTRLLAQGVDETTLYRLATDVLIHLHRQAQAISVAVPVYDEGRLLEEAERFADWFYPVLRGERIPDAVKEDYLAVWRTLLQALPEPSLTLVLRDFHVDNLMRVKRESGAIECGLLDFQDAVIGSTAYDLMSLLEDARRDVDPAVVAAMCTRYLDSRPLAEHAVFDLWYGFLAAQRHCKVAGLFVRLCLRDGKCGYLQHIPRVLRLLQRHLNRPELEPLRAWLDNTLPERLAPLPPFDVTLLRKLMRESF